MKLEAESSSLVSPDENSQAETSIATCEAQAVDLKLLTQENCEIKNECSFKLLHSW